MFGPDIHSIIEIFKNGYYLVMIYPIVLEKTNSHILAWAFTHKALAINYYIHFGHIHENRKGILQVLKPFVRFTDTGFILAILYHMYPTYLFHVTHNVQFSITLGYWGTRAIFNMKDADSVVAENGIHPDTLQINHTFVDLWSHLNHIIPYYLVIVNMLSCDYNDFNNTHLLTTFSVIYAWFILIWIPWFATTGDLVYSVLDFRKSLSTPIYTFIFMHIVLYSSNIFGSFIQTNICNHIHNIDNIQYITD